MPWGHSCEIPKQSQLNIIARNVRFIEPSIKSLPHLLVLARNHDAVEAVVQMLLHVFNLSLPVAPRHLNVETESFYLEVNVCVAPIFLNAASGSNASLIRCCQNLWTIPSLDRHVEILGCEVDPSVFGGVEESFVAVGARFLG